MSESPPQRPRRWPRPATEGRSGRCARRAPDRPGYLGSIAAGMLTGMADKSPPSGRRFALALLAFYSSLASLGMAREVWSKWDRKITFAVLPGQIGGVLIGVWIVAGVKRMRFFWSTSVVVSHTDRENHRLFSIGRVPATLRSFFRPYRQHFSKSAWPHFWGLVLAVPLTATGVEIIKYVRRSIRAAEESG